MFTPTTVVHLLVTILPLEANCAGRSHSVSSKKSLLGFENEWSFDSDRMIPPKGITIQFAHDTRPPQPPFPIWVPNGPTRCHDEQRPESEINFRFLSSTFPPPLLFLLTKSFFVVNCPFRPLPPLLLYCAPICASTSILLV